MSRRSTNVHVAGNYVSVYREARRDENGRFLGFNKSVNMNRALYGYWSFHEEGGCGDDSRALERGYDKPEMIIMGALKGEHVFNDIRLSWISGTLDTFKQARVGTALEHIARIENERWLLNLPRSKIKLPQYVHDPEGQLLHNRCCKGNQQRQPPPSVDHQTAVCTSWGSLNVAHNSDSRRWNSMGGSYMSPYTTVPNTPHWGYGQHKKQQPSQPPQIDPSTLRKTSVALRNTAPQRHMSQPVNSTASFPTQPPSQMIACVVTHAAAVQAAPNEGSQRDLSTGLQVQPPDAGRRIPTDGTLHQVYSPNPSASASNAEVQQDQIDRHFQQPLTSASNFTFTSPKDSLPSSTSQAPSQIPGVDRQQSTTTDTRAENTSRVLSASHGLVLQDSMCLSGSNNDLDFHGFSFDDKMATSDAVTCLDCNETLTHKRDCTLASGSFIDQAMPLSKEVPCMACEGTSTHQNNCYFSSIDPMKANKIQLQEIIKRIEEIPEKQWIKDECISMSPEAEPLPEQLVGMAVIIRNEKSYTNDPALHHLRDESLVMAWVLRQVGGTIIYPNGEVAQTMFDREWDDDGDATLKAAPDSANEMSPEAMNESWEAFRQSWEYPDEDRLTSITLEDVAGLMSALKEDEEKMGNCGRCDKLLLGAIEQSCQH